MGTAAVARAADLFHAGLVEMRGKRRRRLLLELCARGCCCPPADRT
jgi:hypothetical protein